MAIWSITRLSRARPSSTLQDTYKARDNHNTAATENTQPSVARSPAFAPPTVWVFRLLQLPSMGTTVPDDILLLLFAQATPLPWPYVEYDAERAKAPFALASVCQRWRILALSTASLWTYFGFPASIRAQTAHLPRLRLLLSRSGDAEVDVVFLVSDTSVSEEPASRDILRAISTIASRWRYVNLDVPTSCVSIFSGAFQQKWKCLRFLSLQYWKKIEKLPLAHRLAKLYIDCKGLETSNLPISMPNMNNLSINGDGGIYTNNLLVAIAQQLTDLSILEGITKSPQQPILFPRLRSLAVDDVSYLDHIIAPALQTLTFNTSHLGSPPRLTHFTSVTHLCLYGTVHETFLSSLQQFTQIVHLSFEVSDHSKRSWPGIDQYIILGQFFTAVRRSSFNSAPVWPRLAHIRFGDSGSMGSNAIADPQDVIDFVVHRNASQFGPEWADTNNVPTMLQTVTVDFNDAPDLLISELNKIFSTTKDADVRN
ncbi:hypothetical protein BKA62DRAFT_385281 [Auriculariales sp. MPI-PUGE-AT-0066]|nr:hypothetical protein BKA62DRAFT_385281 [Auriculariales sp. MPI-PUGE-AT-0066]